MPVRARVASTAVRGNAIEGQDANHLLGFVNQFARPLLGNATAGFHYWPDPAAPNPGAPAAPGDEVIVLCEQRGWQHGSVSYARPQDMPTGNGGESAMLHKDGRVGVRLLNSGISQALVDPNFGSTGIVGQAGTVTVTASVTAALQASNVTLTAANNLNLNGNLSTLQGTSLASVNSGGAVTVAGNTGVQISSSNGTVALTGNAFGVTLNSSASNIVLTAGSNLTCNGNFSTLFGTSNASVNSAGTVSLAGNGGVQVSSSGGTVLIASTLVLTNQTVGGTSGVPANFPHTVTISINGTTYVIPSLV